MRRCASTGCPERRRLCAKSIPEWSAGRRAGWGRSVSSSCRVLALLMTSALSPLREGFTVFCARGEGGRARRATRGLAGRTDWIWALSAPPTLSCSASTSTRITHTHAQNDAQLGRTALKFVLSPSTLRASLWEKKGFTKCHRHKNAAARVMLQHLLTNHLHPNESIWFMFFFHEPFWSLHLAMILITWHFYYLD